MLRDDAMMEEIIDVWNFLNYLAFWCKWISALPENRPGPKRKLFQPLQVLDSGRVDCVRTKKIISKTQHLLLAPKQSEGTLGAIGLTRSFFFVKPSRSTWVSKFLWGISTCTIRVSHGYLNFSCNKTPTQKSQKCRNAFLTMSLHPFQRCQKAPWPQ